MNINFAVDKAYESKTFKEIAHSPVSAIQGVSEKDGHLLKEAFGIDTVADLAHNKFFRIAEAIVLLAALEEKK